MDAERHLHNRKRHDTDRHHQEMMVKIRNMNDRITVLGQMIEQIHDHVAHADHRENLANMKMTKKMMEKSRPKIADILARSIPMMKMMTFNPMLVHLPYQMMIHL